MVSYRILYVLALFLSLFAGIANAGSADISGSVSYSTSGNTVRIKIGSITNNTTNITTGTLYVTLRMTAGSSPFGSGYDVARQNLTSVGSGGGVLDPGASFTGIDFTTTYTSPPAGTYYVHLYVSEYPDLNTSLDEVTFSSTVTIGSGSSGGSGSSDNSPGGDSFITAVPISINGSVSAQVGINDYLGYYEVTIPSNGTLTVYTTGVTGASEFGGSLGWLYDNTQQSIDQCCSPPTTTFSITHAVSPGIYYIEVRPSRLLVPEPVPQPQNWNYTLVTSFVASTPSQGNNTLASGGSVQLLGTSNWVVDSSNDKVTLFQQTINNNRTTPTGNLRLELFASTVQDGSSGYDLAEYNVGVLSAGSAINGIAAHVPYNPPPDGKYYVRYLLIEDAAAGSSTIDSVDFSTPVTVGGGSSSGGGGAFSIPELIIMIALSIRNIKK